MCWQCDHPGATVQDYLDIVLKRAIAEHGWAVQGVEPTKLYPPWAYTVGLTGCDQPELVVTGMPLRRAAGMLNMAAHHVLHHDGVTPAHGGQVRLSDGSLLEFVELSEPTVHLQFALALYGPEIRAVQLVHTDARGHWPWDRRYHSIFGVHQPVLGPRGRAGD